MPRSRDAGPSPNLCRGKSAPDSRRYLKPAATGAPETRSWRKDSKFQTKWEEGSLLPPVRSAEKKQHVCNNPEDVLEIYSVGPVLEVMTGTLFFEPPPITYLGNFWPYLKGDPEQRQTPKSSWKVSPCAFAYFKRSSLAFTSHVMQAIVKASGIKIENATVKHAQTVGMQHAHSAKEIKGGPF